MRPILFLFLLSCCIATTYAQPLPEYIKGTNGYCYSLIGFGNKVAFVKNYQLWFYKAGDTAALQVNYPDQDYYINQGVAKMAVIKDTLYYSAINAGFNGLVYKWDGSNAPLAAPHAAPPGCAEVQNVHAYNNKLYYTTFTNANLNQLWEYDPSGGAVKCLTNFTDTVTIKNVLGYNNKIMFTMSNFVSYESLHEYDIAAGTTKAVLQGTYPIRNSNYLTVINSKLYFTGRASVGIQLYAYDGVNPPLAWTNFGNSSGTLVGNICNIGNDIFFASEGNGMTGTLAKFHAFNTQTNITQEQIWILNDGKSTQAKVFFAYNGKLYVSWSETGFQMQVYDGKNVKAVGDIKTNLNTFEYLHHNGVMYFTAGSSQGSGLYHFTDWPTDVEYIAKPLGVQLYPNPAADIVTLEFSLQSQKQLSLTLTDAMGRIVMVQPPSQFDAGKNTLQLNIESMATGVYYCSLRDGQGATVWSGKLVKR